MRADATRFSDWDREMLIDRICDLERELGLAEDREAQARIHGRLGVTPSQARLLYALAAAYPKPVANWVLEDTIKPRGQHERSDPTLVKVMVYCTRKRLGRNAIVTAGFGRGYTLTPQMAERVRAAAA